MKLRGPTEKQVRRFSRSIGAKMSSVSTASAVNGSYDVIVIGLGAMGSAAAYELSRRGQRVLGLEQYFPGHDKGSSHGSTRLIRKSSFEHPTYVPLGLRAYEAYAELEKAAGRRLVTKAGGLYVGAPNESYVRQTIENAKLHNIEHAVLDREELSRRYPQVAARDDQIAYYESDIGVVAPGKCIIAQQQLAQQNGADLHFSEAVLSWEADDAHDWVRVHTEEGVYEAPRLVITPGAWAPRLLADMGVPIEIERHWIFWFKPLDGHLEELRVGNYPLVTVVDDEGVAFTSWPAFGNEDLVKATFVHIDADACTPETMTTEPISSKELAHIKRSMEKYVPGGAGELVDMQACMYTNAPDEHFVICKHPGHDNVSVAAAMAGHGFKFAPVVGEILADLTIDGKTDYDIELFNAARFTNSLAQ